MSFSAAQPLSYSTPGGIPGQMVCNNTLDDTFWNKCHLQFPPGVLRTLGDTVQPFFNPRSLAIAAALVVVGLPVIVSSSRAIRISPASYHAIKISGLHFLYRACYSLVLDVALYAVFQQRRPCICSWNDGKFEQVGSVYGMPSGDSMMGALFGAWIWDAGPRNHHSTIFGIWVMLIVMIERVSWGDHSVLQACVGASFGIILYYWSSRAPQFMVLIESMVIIPLGYLLLFLDPARQEWSIPASKHPGFQLNLMAWFTFGVAFQLLAVTLICRHYCALGVMGRIRWSLVTVLEGLDQDAMEAQLSRTKGPQPEDTPMAESLLSHQSLPSEHSYQHFSEETYGEAQEALLDTGFTAQTALFCSLIIALQAVITNEALFSSAGLK